MKPYTLDEIIAAFCTIDGGYRREQVDAALAMRDEIAPRLIELLETIRREPAKYAENDNFTGQLYAVMLLGFWRESTAHRAIVDLFRLPERFVEPLFGELVTEDLPMILHRTSGGSLERIRALAQDRSASVYCRSSAIRAMTYAVADGTAARSEVLEFIDTLLHSEAGDPDFMSMLISDANRLYPLELRETIQQAFEKGLVDTFFIGFQDIEATLRGTPEEALARVRREMQYRTPADFHESMAWWAMFEPAPTPSPSGGAIPAPVHKSPPAQPTQRAAKPTHQQQRKQKRKQRKATKRQQRRH